jgi:hypothetical protein
MPALERGTKDRRVDVLDVEDLHLDTRNPRLPEDLVGKAEPKVLKYLFEHGVLDELAQSFMDNGYFVAEPLIVTTERGRSVVLEGNRRLATLMILHRLPVAEGLSFVGIEPADGELKSIRKVPCYVVSDRADVVPFIGFRHIGGLKMWEPEAKARYVLHQVDEAHDEGDTENPFLDVARRVGSNTQSIRGSYVAIAILRHARDDLGLNVNRLLSENRFGVWQRALSSPELRKFIGFGDPTTYEDVRASLKSLKKERLREVISDFVPSASAERAVVGDSRLVTEYGKVLANKEAHAVLRRTGDLDLARQITDELDLPARVQKLKSRASVLREEIARVEMTGELRAAIDELFVECRQMKALTNAPS